MADDRATPNDVRALMERFGDVSLEHVTLSVRPQFRRRYRQRGNQGRRGEIVFVLERSDSSVLLHTKRSYPPGVWRLPTGGIDRGEELVGALHREIREETGFRTHPGEEQLLGVLTYALAGADGAPDTDFTSYVFRVAGDFGAPVPEDESEGISGFEWVGPEGLVRVASDLRTLGASAPARADWGRFRAVVHDFTARTLWGFQPNEP